MDWARDILAVLLLLSMPALFWAVWPRPHPGDHPAKCASVLRLMADRGGVLEELDPDWDRYSDELVMASRLGLTATSGGGETRTWLTEKGRRYLNGQ